MFKMIAGLFGVGNYNPFIFWKYPFRSFEVAFDDRCRIAISREDSSISPFESYPTISYIKGRGRPKKYDVGKNIKRDLLRRLHPAARREVSDDDLMQILSSLGEDNLESEPFRTLYGGYYRGSDRFADIAPEPVWLEDIRARLDVHFVDTDRLLIRKRTLEDGPTSLRTRGSEITSAATIEENSKDLKRRISEVIVEANRTENDLNRSFPSNVVSSVLQQEESWSYGKVLDELEMLDERRNRLVEAGILDLTPGR